MNKQPSKTPITDYLMSKAGRVKIPLSGTFELSPVCNLSCKMCYVRKTMEEVRRHPRPMRTLEEWISTAEEAQKAGMLYLLLTGGEPFLWPDFWKLYDRLSEMGFLLTINTNGTLIDDEAVKKLLKHPPVRLNITLYGASDETYETLCGTKGMFTRVSQHIRCLKESGITVKINCSLTPYNVCDLEKMVHFAKELDLLFSPTTYMFPPIRRLPEMIGQNDRFTPEEAAYYHLEVYRMQSGEEQYQLYLKNILDGVITPPGLDEHCIDPIDGNVRCSAGKASFWITWDGYLTPCGMMPEPKTDLNATSFTIAWNQLTDAGSRLKLSGICKSCVNQKICHACAAMAYAETGTVSGIPTYMCDMMVELKKLAKQNFRPMANAADVSDKNFIMKREEEK